MPNNKKKHTAVVHCVGSGAAFIPSDAIEDTATHEKALQALDTDNDFETAIKTWFRIPDDDAYEYLATASVALAQVQRVINMGGANGMHAWYWSGESVLPPPPKADIEAYISIFQPTTQTAAALRTFLANAHKTSIRHDVAQHLTTTRFLSPSHPSSLIIPKTKPKNPAPLNPYLDFWAWSCRALQWCGPLPLPQGSPHAHRSHHVLPILMHHFGCAVPSHEALCILRSLAGGRDIADVGSGAGYWTFMLRRYGCSVVPIDSGQSSWRVTWVDDTVIADGPRWLAANTAPSTSTKTEPAKDVVLLLVYPIVGGTEGGFTRGVMAAYRGDTVAVVGTQNHSGYTGFRDMTMDEYMQREHGDEWTKIVQISLPSFAGKDEALFVFQRREKGAANV
ncbi:hypothetical protein B0T19DRAFT_37925 [Cercophora scortea]|uniref:Uncharacterized protein n=1 Tax=Cercophora scortea TaxID=314031 RepID=A0AAE0MKX1_9PEZI|nr:hypothetical protein B0T19DRAFT_37925 [Cercophora scortea]